MQTNQNQSEVPKQRTKANKVETDKRIRAVMEWIIQDYPYCDIVSQICQTWGVEERQAKRYIAAARERWGEQEDELLEQKLIQQIHRLKKLKRSLKSEYLGTPKGIRAVLAVEKQIMDLEKLKPPTKVQISTPDGPIVEQQIVYVKETNVDYTKLSDEVLQQIVQAKKKSD